MEPFCQRLAMNECPKFPQNLTFERPTQGLAACEEGHAVEVVQKLLAAGADVNAIGKVRGGGCAISPIPTGFISLGPTILLSDLSVSCRCHMTPGCG